jgi:predicted anti-sigma-YlaC factor YlaD
MTQASDTHFTEEELTAHAMGEPSASIAAHLVGCVTCAKLVEQIGRLKTDIAELPDEDVPASVRRRILSSARFRGHASRRKPGHPFLDWVRSPAVLVVGAMLLLFLLYFAYVSFG